MNRKDQLSALLSKYRKGACSEKELELLELWLSELDQSAEQVSPDNETERQTLRLQTRENIMQHLHPVPSSVSRSLWPGLMKVAAILLAVLTAGYFLNPQLQRLLGSNAEQQTALAWDTISTPQGKVKKVMLDDQSTVFLSASSKIRVSPGFGKSNRNLEILEGEAWFDVVKNPELPFSVKSGQLRTVVLGTQFIVTTHPGFKNVEVNVTRGKVKVEDGNHQQDLLPGQAVNYAAETGSMEVKPIHVAFDPINQRYIITGCSFSELAARIETLFGYTLVPASAKVKEKYYTGEIDPRQSVRMVMTKFLEIHHYKFEIRGKEVHIQ